MPDGQASLEVRDAYRRFGRIDALAGVTLSVRGGEWLGLVGPNGAGKTTLMRAIAGLVPLDRGSVHLLGRRVAGIGRRNRQAGLGVVPQSIALYPALTARENLDVFGRLHGLRRSRLSDRIAWALEWTRLAAHADRPVGSFSGGMRRRLNIACAVLHDPRVVLLDEPTVGVDPQGRGRIWEMLDGLRAAGTALLQSSHQLRELEAHCDRLVVLDHGRVVAAGTMEQLAAQVPVADRVVRLVLDRAPNGFGLPAGFEADGRVVRGSVREVSVELPALLERVRSAGLRVDHLELTSPGLEAVFTHLTGAELRE